MYRREIGIGIEEYVDEKSREITQSLYTQAGYFWMATWESSSRRFRNLIFILVNSQKGVNSFLTNKLNHSKPPQADVNLDHI